MKTLVISVLGLGLVVSAAPASAQSGAEGLEEIVVTANGRMDSFPSEPATYGITFRKNWN